MSTETTKVTARVSAGDLPLEVFFYTDNTAKVKSAPGNDEFEVGFTNNLLPFIIRDGARKFSSTFSYGTDGSNAPIFNAATTHGDKNSPTPRETSQSLGAGITS